MQSRNNNLLIFRKSRIILGFTAIAAFSKVGDTFCVPPNEEAAYVMPLPSHLKGREGRRPGWGVAPFPLHLLTARSGWQRPERAKAQSMQLALCYYSSKFLISESINQ